MTLPVTFKDIEEAADRIKGEAIRTPLLKSRYLDEITGASVHIKPECLQRTGSFKFRGAYNTISRIEPSQRAKGVVACSSGNHAQGVAAASGLVGAPATIVMPHDAPKTKWERTKALGAEIVGYDRETESRDDIAAEIVEKTGASFVHPFNNPHVVAGQGTVGLECVEQMREAGETPDSLFVCCGGGGLASGVAVATTEIWPDLDVHPVEPAGFDDYTRSLELGERVSNASSSGSVCDAILTETPGELSFEIAKKRMKNGLVVTDEEALDAVKFAFQELKLVVEPGGAVALAALLNSRAPVKGRTIVIVISGGNTDPDVFQRALGRP